MGTTSQTFDRRERASTPALPEAVPERHPALVRVTHWLTTLAFFALLISGAEIALSHPRFYWGETGNVNVRPWLNLHLPSSRDTVPTGYGYVLPDANGWSRYLHFQAAWLVVAVGFLYVVWGLFNGHFRRNVCPEAKNISVTSLGSSIVRHLRFERPARTGGVVVQRASAVKLSARDLRAVSPDDLDRVGNVVGFRCGLSLGGSNLGRAADGALDSLHGHRIARAFSAGPHRHDLCCWVRKADAGHDCWQPNQCRDSRLGCPSSAARPGCHSGRGVNL